MELKFTMSFETLLEIFDDYDDEEFERWMREYGISSSDIEAVVYYYYDEENDEVSAETYLFYDDREVRYYPNSEWEVYIKDFFKLWKAEKEGKVEVIVGE